MYVGLQKTSLVNFPRHVAAVVFLPGCNMRCPYCYNAALACAPACNGIPKDNINTYVPIETAYTLIEKRKNVLTGVVISGGEALLSPALPELIRRIRHAGLAVKLDTNGLMPQRLYALLSDYALCPDMLAVDLKTSLHRYGELIPANSPLHKTAGNRLYRTLTLLQNKTDFARPVTVEYRTVLVPPLVAKADIENIASHLSYRDIWCFAPFLPKSCLNPKWNNIKPYTHKEMEELVSIAKKTVFNSILR